LGKCNTERRVVLAIPQGGVCRLLDCETLQFAIGIIAEKKNRAFIESGGGNWSYARVTTPGGRITIASLFKITWYS